VTLSTEDLIDNALALSKDVEDNFLELGKSLRQLQDRDPDLFHQIIEKTTLGRRKAYYLAACRTELCDWLSNGFSALRRD
jgi:hypothetical protein